MTEGTLEWGGGPRTEAAKVVLQSSHPHDPTLDKQLKMDDYFISFIDKTLWCKSVEDEST